MTTVMHLIFLLTIEMDETTKIAILIENVSSKDTLDFNRKIKYNIFKLIFEHDDREAK